MEWLNSTTIQQAGGKLKCEKCKEIDQLMVYFVVTCNDWIINDVLVKADGDRVKAGEMRREHYNFVLRERAAYTMKKIDAAMVYGALLVHQFLHVDAGKHY